jgi:DNA (cytosine-5)-methyltransferase 1
MLALLGSKVDAERPRWVLLENVPALVTSHGGADLRALVSALNALGYGVEPMVVNAAFFTPQSRPRLFLIATRADELPEADPSVAPEHPARPASLRRAMRGLDDLLWHARELPAIGGDRPDLEGVLETLEPDDSRWWPADRATYFLNQIHPAHRELADRLIAGERTERRPAFRRVRTVGGAKRSLIELRDDGLAGCLRTPKGGSAKQIIFEAGRGEYRVRFMTSAEAARLQGVDAPLPERFSETDLLFALGDAVCVPAVRWVLDALLQSAGAPSTMATLDEQPSRSAPASIIATASS